MRARVETSAGGVVFRREPDGIRFLLIRDPYENWGLPKGHVEGEETPVEAALREVAEETGLPGLRAAEELPTIDWYFRDRGRLVHKFCHFYLVESPVGDPTPQRGGKRRKLYRIRAQGSRVLAGMQAALAEMGRGLKARPSTR